MIQKDFFQSIIRTLAATVVLWFISHNVLPAGEKDIATQVITSLIDGVLFYILMHYFHRSTSSDGIDVVGFFKNLSGKLFVSKQTPAVSEQITQ